MRSRNRWNGGGLAATVIVALSLLLILPALVTGNALGGDANVHVAWQAHFAPEVWRGIVYPRWLPAISHGFGSPAFFFYPPMAQWAGSLFHPVLPGAEQAMNRLILGVWLTSALGGWGCWRWLRALGLDGRHALFGTACFLLFPYRCFVDFYVRGALAELTALNLMPWLLYTATRLRDGKSGGFGGYALAVGAMLYCNFPAAEIGVLFATGYIVAMTGWRAIATLVRAAAATLCGFLIGAAPVATTLGLFGHLIDTSSLWSARNMPTNWLLFSGRPWVDPAMLALTVGSLALTIVAGGAGGAIALRSQQRDIRRATLFLLAGIAVVALLNSVASRPFWFMANPLSRIQFPFRLLSASTVAVAGIAAMAAQVLHEREGGRARTIRRLLWSALPALLLLDTLLFGIRVHRNRYTPEPTAQQMIADNVDVMHEFVIGRLDLLEPAFGTAPAVVVAGDAIIRPIATGNRRIVVETVGDAPATVALRQFAFTGWSCSVDGGTGVRAGVLPYPYNVPVCHVPAGRHRLTARLPATGIERMGTMLTIAGLLIALGTLLAARLRRNVVPPVER